MSTDVRISFEPKSAPLSKAAIPETPPLGRGRCSQGLSVGASVRPSRSQCGRVRQTLRLLNTHPHFFHLSLT